MADDDANDDETDMTEEEFDVLWEAGTPTPVYISPNLRVVVDGKPVGSTIYFDFITREVRGG